MRRLVPRLLLDWRETNMAIVLDRKTLIITILCLCAALGGFGAWYLLAYHVPRMSPQEASEFGKKQTEELQLYYRQYGAHRVPAPTTSTSAPSN